MLGGWLVQTLLVVSMLQTLWAIQTPENDQLKKFKLRTVNEAIIEDAPLERTKRERRATGDISSRLERAMLGDSSGGVRMRVKRIGKEVDQPAEQNQRDVRYEADDLLPVLSTKPLDELLKWYDQGKSLAGYVRNISNRVVDPRKEDFTGSVAERLARREELRRQVSAPMRRALNDARVVLDRAQRRRRDAGTEPENHVIGLMEERELGENTLRLRSAMETALNTMSRVMGRERSNRLNKKGTY